MFFPFLIVLPTLYYLENILPITPVLKRQGFCFFPLEIQASPFIPAGGAAAAMQPAYPPSWPFQIASQGRTLTNSLTNHYLCVCINLTVKADSSCCCCFCCCFFSSPSTRLPSCLTVTLTHISVRRAFLIR